MKGWSKVKLGEVISERREMPNPNDLDSGRIKIVGKISFNSGQIQLRNSGNTKTGMILVRPGDLLISGINASKGAIAIYDESFTEPVAATIHYGSYIPNSGKVDTKFLWWMLRSQVFQELLNEYVPGGIKTELKAKRLLPIPIPLPPLTEQRQIVKLIEELAIHINEARNLAQRRQKEIDAIVGCILFQVVDRNIIDGVLSDVLEAPPRNGWSVRCDNAEDGMAVLSLSSVTGFKYSASEFKRTSVYTKDDGHYWLKSGDLLMTRSNTPELVGHTAIYDGNPSPCIYPDLMMRLITKVDMVNKRFVWYWLQSPVVRKFILQKAKGTSPTMKKISQRVVMKIPFPTSLPITDQCYIVNILDELQFEIDKIKIFQNKTASEIESLLPAILDRAFKGRL
ncbi:MAG: restriction endonuclease subunit S [Deltaproteobacteria bacterium]|nr:restriction endonuclease subunit S [Deltaproteobacteria bacterium]